MSREYQNAGTIIDQVASGSNFKAVCNKTKVGKIDYLLASETLKYKSVLETILKNAGDVSADSIDIGSQGMLLVLVYEVLVGSGKVRGGGKVKRAVMDRMDAIKDALAKLLKERDAETIKDLLPAHAVLANELPHFLRINTLKVREKEHYAQVFAAITKQCPAARMDAHIDNLVVLPPQTPSFGQHEYVKDGSIIIQDKASCFPSQILGDAWSGGDIIDACAAPGNKTSHVTAVVTSKMDKGKQQKKNKDEDEKKCESVYAFDKSPTRMELLQARMRNAGADGLVTVTQADFLTVKVHDSKYSKVSAVLLDPSCSGSGVARDLGRLGNNDKDSKRGTDRLEKLRTFQVQAVNKAMSFPAVTLVSYSTCSVWEEENESVVNEILNKERRSEGWHLVAPPRLASWKRRGLAFGDLTNEESECMIRCAPADGVNGFFVALFAKKNQTDNKEEVEEEVAEEEDADDGDDTEEDDDTEEGDDSDDDTEDDEGFMDSEDWHTMSAMSAVQSRKRKASGGSGRVWRPLHKLGKWQ
jgi:putative methyltransferase